MKKGIIFDVDGTLWDSATQVAQSWQVAAEKLLNRPRPITPDMISRNMGKNMKDFGDALFPDLPVEKRMEVMAACMNYENQYLLDHPGTLYPNAGEVLSELSKKYELFIVSNCQSGYIEVLMEACDLKQYITDIECYGNTNLSKAENISLVIRRNHLDCSFYLGDTAMDAQAAKDAGIPFVHAAYGFGKVEDPEAVIHDLAQPVPFAETFFKEN